MIPRSGHRFAAKILLNKEIAKSESARPDLALARGSQRAPPQDNGEGEQKRHREPLLSGLNDVLEPVRKDQRRRPLRSLYKETPGGPGARWKAGGMGVSRGAFEFGI